LEWVETWHGSVVVVSTVLKPVDFGFNRSRVRVRVRVVACRSKKYGECHRIYFPVKNSPHLHNVLSHPIARSTPFGVWGLVHDVMKHAKYQLNQFKGYRAPGTKNEPPTLTWLIALTTVYILTFWWGLMTGLAVIPNVYLFSVC